MTWNQPKRLARGCLAIAPLIWACSIHEVEGMALVSPDAIVVGDTASLRVVARDGSMPSASSVAWTSSDSAIATVDELGVVTGVGPGWVMIEARSGDYTLEVALLVWTTAPPFVSMGTGIDHSCGVAEDGRAWCWGSHERGQMGAHFAPDRCPVPGGGFLWCSKAAIPVDTDLRFTEIAVGHYHNCGLSIEGTAYCWGLNDRGQLGDGGVEARPTPAPVADGDVFTSLMAGGRTTCGITEEDALLCWGSDLTSTDGRTIATHVGGEHRFALAVTSGNHTCGLTRDGATHCWGLNNHGELGVQSVDSVCGSSPCTHEPQAVEFAPPFDDLALGDRFSCGLTAAGVAYCWGRNEHGQLGDGTRTDRWEPMPVAGGHTFTRLEAARDHACGVDGAGLLHCWGRDGSNFGNGGDLVEADQPVPGGSGLRFTEISIGFSTQCGMSDSDVTWCWGPNLKGTLGNGRSQPIPVTTPVRVVQHHILY